MKNMGEQKCAHAMSYQYFICLGQKNLKSIILIISEGTIDGKTTVEHRFYISSLKKSAKIISSAIRKHWSVENSLHWSLDVAFREDQCRVRIGEAAENFSLLRKIALMYLKNGLLRRICGSIQVRLQKNYY